VAGGARTFWVPHILSARGSAGKSRLAPAGSAVLLCWRALCQHPIHHSPFFMSAGEQAAGVTVLRRWSEGDTAGTAVHQLETQLSKLHLSCTGVISSL